VPQHTRRVVPTAGLLAVILAATLSVPAPAATPAPAFRFTGYGTDHGVGLSQRGAAGRAKAGQTYDQILAHYFPGTILGRVSPSTTIRALVVSAYPAAPTFTRLAQGKVTPWRIDTPAVADRTFPPNAVLVLVGVGRAGAWSLEVRKSLTDDSVLAAFQDDDADLRMTPVPPADTATDPTGDVRVLARSGPYDRFAGTLRIGRKAGKVRMVNEVGIESFVRSVTPTEMGPSNLPETLKTQAVATRSYFLAGRHPDDPWFDVPAYKPSHSYKGIAKEEPAVSAAVDATAYRVLKWEGRIARTFYFAVGGGATETSANVFTNERGEPGATRAYLVGSLDVDEAGVPYDVNAADYAWATDAFTLAQLSSILARDPRTDVGSLRSWPVGTEADFRRIRGADPARPANRGVSGRLTWVILDGTKARKRVAGWLFKTVFNAYRGGGDPLKSTLLFRSPAP
jgi:hypothetical protein